MHLIKSYYTAVIVVDACFSSPCLNGATCEADYGSGLYQCICVTDYTGTRCETCKIQKRGFYSLCPKACDAIAMFAILRYFSFMVNLSESEFLPD